MPKRIQRRRTRGWRMPLNTVYVGRPTKWGNPYSAAEQPSSNVEFYFNDLDEGMLPFTREDIRTELRGKNLACWCPLDQACHADVLLEIANE